MRLLQEVKDSVLWLIETDLHASTNLRRETASRGVSADRLIFAPRMKSQDHLARHRVADLFLDTLPYNAHTTAQVRTGSPAQSASLAVVWALYGNVSRKRSANR